MIEFKNVKKSFGERTILQDVSFKIPKGSISFIIGKSGEGKSVTIKHIIGLLKPDSGEVFFDNKDITSLEEESLLEHRKRIGMLFQHAALFDSLTVYENIAFPLRVHTKLKENELNDKVMEVISALQIEEYIQKLPAELSTGEKKRVGLARALITKPQVILYDEPTTGMDPLICEMIDKLIVQVNDQNKDLTSIVISHDLKAALDTAHQIIMLYQGRVHLSASPKEFLSSKDPIVRQFLSGDANGPMKLA